MIGTVGAWLAIIGVALFVFGLLSVVWDWVALNNPDAPHGGPVVLVGIVLLLFAGMAGCAQTLSDVQEMKRKAGLCRPLGNGSNLVACPALSVTQSN